MRFLTLLIVLAGCGEETPSNVDDTVDFEGRTYAIETAGMRIPGADSGMADLLRLGLGQTTMLTLFNVSETSMDVRMGLAEPGSDPMVQDPCSTTTDLGAATRTGNTITVGPQDVDFGGYVVQDMVISTTLSTSGEQARDMTFEGVLDMRFAEDFGFGTAEGMCDTVGDFGVPCQPCTDGSDTCIDLVVEGLVANYQEGAFVSTVSSVAASCEE